jgi:hypothetical protein
MQAREAMRRRTKRRKQRSLRLVPHPTNPTMMRPQIRSRRYSKMTIGIQQKRKKMRQDPHFQKLVVCLLGMLVSHKG